MEAERQCLDVDIACVGFGPAVAGFLDTLSKGLAEKGQSASFESKALPGMPLQVVCFERADDLGFGVSGVVTRARALRKSLSDAELREIPFCCPVREERILYLLDPIGASRRPLLLKAADVCIRTFRWALPYKDDALNLLYVPPFLRKEGGLLLSMGQFTQAIAMRLMASGAIQIWPGSPVAEPLFEEERVVGIRLADQGVDKSGRPDQGYLPGMDVRARLTVVGDGPVGAVGRSIDRRLGLPEDHHQRDWAVGMKMLVELPKDCALEAGTVIHTLGYPEPEIFGFLYVYPEGLASLGIFVPSWFDSPVRTAYRYLQHWMLHPYLYRFLKGGKLRSWGAKTLQESGRRGEPRLVGDGFARIGEGSGTTNVLTNSGVDEAWMSGVLLAEGVLDLLDNDKPLTKENLIQAYVRRRRESALEKEARIAEKARDGFQKGFIPGLIGTALSGLSGGRLNLGTTPKRPSERIPSLAEYYRGTVKLEELESIRRDCEAGRTSLHDALMERSGWPAIPYDGNLLISHQDALLMGGKVQAPPGFADHVAFLYPELCRKCGSKICIELCSGQAITPGDDGVPQFDREKCVHCGACVWNCSQAHPEDPERGLIDFRAGAGGLHSAEN